ncbi:MAG: tRNA dihydrouridine synthase DusB [Candidatus Omnitrophota bacterium]
MNELKIGNISLKEPFILAPLAGISDLPFRMLNRGFGCDFAFTGMLSAKALFYNDKNTIRLLSTLPEDRPLGVQLFGNEPEIIKIALERLRNYTFDLIDLNAACPVPKVTKRGEGAALLKNPRKIGQLIKVLADNAEVPVTIKIRAGWDDTSVNAKDVALYAEDAGANALIIHGRTKTQGYRGKVDYETIRKVKDAIKIPVIASGDIFSAQSAKKMFDETGCDGVLIARGALGNPWIFKEIKNFFGTGQIFTKPPLDEIISTMLKHLELNSNFYGERGGIINFRKFFMYYTKGVAEIKLLRREACRAKTKIQLEDVIKKIGL